MNILFATSEAAPFAKTGGLADVCSALPDSLSQLGHNVSIILPAYSQIYSAGLAIESTGKELVIPVGTKTVRGELLYSHLPDSRVTVYFVRHDDYYHRDGLYNSGGVDYPDNCERFVFFCRSVLESIRLLNLPVDLIHANDWQTGLVPAYLNILYKSKSPHKIESTLFADASEENIMSPQQLEHAHQYYDAIHTVFTIHNMRHQGRFWRWDMALTGIDWRYFTFDRMEFYNQLNLLKTGIIFSDAVTTVSPRYAQEIQTEGFGEKLQGVLRYRSDVLSGILNGIDVTHWNPETDVFLDEPYARYNTQTVFENKPKCKRALQKEFGLPELPEVPLFGIVSRFDSQKGLDLVAEIMPHFVEQYGAQLVVLGTGDHALEQRFSDLNKLFPQNISTHLTFSDAASHHVEAGCDLFFMPSRYEPCGLNQMYSHRYGTLPLVRETGGLADTVINASDETMANGTANGFSFFWGNPDDLAKATQWALYCYHHRKPEWRKMVTTAMEQDWSWNRSALRYYELYKKCLES
ncbi:MAG: glycogen/starch synthase [Planctomycetia bacterium]|nr:glycogen/starch synthase [Planctomycetia bacterium]